MGVSKPNCMLRRLALKRVLSMPPVLFERYTNGNWMPWSIFCCPEMDRRRVGVHEAAPACKVPVVTFRVGKSMSTCERPGYCTRDPPIDTCAGPTFVW